MSIFEKSLSAALENVENKFWKELKGKEKIITFGCGNDKG